MENCYLYNSLNEPVSLSHNASVALSIPLKRFQRTSGCTTGTGRQLKKSDIGKKFKVEILDPVQMGVCIFLGFGMNAIPKSKFKETLQGNYNIESSDLVFRKTGKDACIFVVDPRSCDATPVVPKKK